MFSWEELHVVEKSVKGVSFRMSPFILLDRFPKSRSFLNTTTEQEVDIILVLTMSTQYSLTSVVYR